MCSIANICLFYIIRSPIGSLYKRVMLDPESKVTNANKDAIVTSVKHSKKQNFLLKFFDILSKSNILAELATLVPLDKDEVRSSQQSKIKCSY